MPLQGTNPIDKSVKELYTAAQNLNKNTIKRSH